MYESKKLLRKRPHDRLNLIKTVEEKPRMGIYCGGIPRIFSDKDSHNNFNKYFYDSGYGRQWLSLSSKVDRPYEVILPECLL